MERRDLSIGEEFELQLEPVRLPDIVRYAGASGDFNPSHYDRDLAVSAGFQTNFAQGMLTAGLLGVAVAERYGVERVRGYGVRFVSPLWCDEAPSISGKVETVSDGLAHVVLTVSAGGRDVLRGWADISL